MTEKKKSTKKKTKAAVTKKTVKKAVAKKTVKKASTSAKKTVSKKPISKPTSSKGKATATTKTVKKAVKPKKAAVPFVAPQPETSPKILVQTSHCEAPQVVAQEQYPWQDRYGDNRCVLMIRDPYWCFVYWDLSSDRHDEIRKETQINEAKFVLRINDVTDIEFDGNNAHRTMDIEVSTEAINWYINVWAADRSYCVDLGLLYSDGHIVVLARSNVVATPRDSVSPVVDEEWMVVDETFDQLYQTAGAAELGRSSEAITKYMLKRVRADVTSGGIASMGSEGGRPKPEKAADFWLVANTELIVYGATEPDATVTVQGQPLRLNQDGTFSVRYALPDGKQTIVVQAVNAEGTQERKVTPVVEKHTD
jgi:uncharacterized protein